MLFYRRTPHISSQYYVLSPRMPAKPIETPAIFHKIHKHAGGTTGRHLVTFKDTASKLAFLEHANFAESMITREWDIGVAGAKAFFNFSSILAD